MADFADLAKPLTIGNVEIRNRVFLAPMSGVTDEPFRKRAYRHGAGLVVSEMVASGELAKGHATSGLRIRHSGLPVHMVQLAGREAAHMAEGARIAAGEGADIIDINMGCPAKKVTGGYAGSALMRDLDHALSLIEAVIGAVDVPVTVKMRLGWDEDALNAPELARRAERAGVKMVTIPVVANGDIATPQDAREILAQSGADAVMVGRSNYGAPWSAGSIAAKAGAGNICEMPQDGAACADYVVAHYEDMLSLYGVESGLRQARKHLGWYLERHAAHVAAETRSQILTSFDPGHVVMLLRQVFAGAECVPARAA
jgi:tRNA-dihydrouridine synthase